jgi:hypothetical protein
MRLDKRKGVRTMLKRLLVLSVVMMYVFMTSASSGSLDEFSQEISYSEETFRLSFKLPAGWEDTPFYTSKSSNDKKWNYSDSGNIITLVIVCEDLWISKYRDAIWADLSDRERSSLPNERQTYDFKTDGVLKRYLNKFETDYKNLSPSITSEEINGTSNIKIEFSYKFQAVEIWARIYTVIRDGVFYSMTFTTPYPTQKNWTLFEDIVRTAVYQVL